MTELKVPLDPRRGPTQSAILDVRDLHTYFGPSHVLQGASLDVHPGEVVGVVGPNGAGKSTLLHTIMGLVHPRLGQILIDGVNLAGRPPHVVARAGLRLVPQGRRLFGSLTVRENLAVAGRHGGASATWTVARVFDLFPRLAERIDVRAKALSGGEQQMLAIARSLLGNPRILLMDEPSEGLAPMVVRQVAAAVDEIRRGNVAVLVVEQNEKFAKRVSDRITVMRRGVLSAAPRFDPSKDVTLQEVGP